MKTIKAACIFDQLKNGDCFTEWLNDFDAAVAKAQRDFNALSTYDKKRREVVYVTEYECEVEDDEGAEAIELIDDNAIREVTIYSSHA